MKKNYLTIYKKLDFKAILVLILALIYNVTNSQTIISPTGDGGFENGTTFAANGWTAANGGNGNRNWYVGTGQTGYTGNRCAFIGNNATTVGSNGSARIQHFYRLITIPAGATNIQLSFNYKQAVSDYSFSTYYDFISVYTSATVPTGNTVAPGALVFGPYPNVSVPTFTSQSTTLSNALAGTTTNLIFTFQCDNISPDAYGAIDDISLTYTPSVPPTITNLATASSGCVGSSITITGTNFTGIIAANVKIGGTPVTSITSNNGSTIVAVVGTGTTGTVSVTNGAGTATSIGTFTVNQLPANPGNPTSNSPQCNPPGVTLTSAGIPPGTENYYWQTASLGTTTTNNTSTYTATTSGTYYIRAQTISTGCWSAGQGGLAVVVDTAISTLATVPSPTNAATGVCYSGTGAISSVSWTAAAGATSYDVYFGAGSLPGSITSNVATTSYSTGTLLASTTYYWKIVPRNSCGISSATPITWTFTTGSAPCSCTPTGNLDCTSWNDYISNVTFNSLNNTTTCSSGGYAVYPVSGTQTTTLITGQTYTFSLTVGPGTGTHGAAVWIDFNQNGVFTDAGEYFLISNTITPNTTTPISITIPAGAGIGQVQMRVRYAFNITVPSTTSCTLSGTLGETEDYTITLIAPAVCTTPTAQPTSLNLTVLGTTINGSFTAASPAPSGYLIVRSTSATAPDLTLNNGTPYAVGYTGLTPGTTYVIQGSAVTSNAVTFSDSGLVANTQYYYYIFSYNSSCTGTPFYLPTTPLTNNATTCGAVTPTSPVNSAISGTGFTVTWTASAGAVNYVLEVYTNAGYTTPAPGSPFTVASPTVTYTVTGLTGPVTYYYRIRATNGSCSSGYVTGTVTTLITNDECSGAIPLTVSTSCSYSNYSNVGATASVGITAPGCANYQGGDVWFSAVVPSTGQLDVDTQTGGITNSGMAFYSGNCGALTLLECDDADSANGNMSYITMNGLTPGQTIYIRVWEKGNNNTGTFGICATTPSCPSPADIYFNILNNTTVTIGWLAPTPSPSGGYNYYYNTTGTAPTSSTTPSGSTSAGITSVTLTFTTGVKYYFWVRANCGGSDVSTWFGPTNFTPCAVGSGLGTTTLTCSDAIAGGVGMSGVPPADLNCSALSCPTLEVSYLPLKETTSYTVASIPYAPPYQFTCLQNAVSVNVDDIWSPTVNLPFNFCFYGVSYNKCLIGSNGVISFNTTTYTPGGYNEWSFNTNLPNTSLIRNAIFGVYHDIDPSKGGQVGWELVPLTNGCRALVASWNEIPMYSSTCNSIYYTGMMVLYENTNIIDVYIKEKNVCDTWNNGNAIVGLQNQAGNLATVAPGRNGLDTDWTVGSLGEAWRFTPNGNPLPTTVQWYKGSVSVPNLIAGATSNTLNVCPTATTTYTAQVIYPLCTGNLTTTATTTVTINGNKTWNGSTDTNWNVGSNWTPSGVPTSANCIVVPQLPVGNIKYPIISGAPDGLGYNLNVNANASLTINSNQNLTITDKVTTAGTFTINNSASLIQINNILNSGNIIYKRDAPSVRTLDYVYWASPVAAFNVSNIVSPYTFGAIYQWNTTISNGNAGWGQWQNASGAMVTAKGYIARTPGTAPFNNSTTNVLNGTFTGVPNNGNITIPIERGPDQNLSPHTGTNGTQITNLSDNWNLLGNPYPSSIRGSQFLFDNNTKIEGNIRLWTHGTLPSVIQPSPFYGSYLSNYTPGDYLTYNFTGTSCCPTAPSDLFIGAGQGFFVQMIDGAPVSAANNITVAFNNNLRSATYSNSTFYKTENVTTTSSTFDVNNIERNRIWLDLINPNNQTDRILFGYIQNATMGRDSFFDCITQNTGASLIYSLVDDTKFSTQGRALPFDINDEVTIGLNAPTPGIYTIGIAAVDGLFDTQNIYLKDNLLNITHNLKTNPYNFTTQSGEINDRFKIVYIDNALGNPDYTFENNIKVMVNNQVAVSSSNLVMESIVVYNVLGQKLATYKNINSNYLTLSNLQKNNTTLLLNIKLQTGETVIKKIIY